MPTITNLKIGSNSGLDGDTLTMATAGSTVVTILGTNFGPASHSDVSAEYVTTLTGLTSTLGQSTYSLDSSACTVASHTRMDCTTVTGVGSSFKWDVTVGGQQTTTSSNGVDAGLVTTYAAPTVTSAASDNTLSTAGGSGTVFTVTGTNFGPGDDDDNEATVTYQNTGLSNLAGTEFTAGSCDVTSDTTIECEMAAGVGHDFTVTVKVGDQTGSGATTLSYAAPVISSLSPTTGLATTGSETVTLTGTYFGPDVDSNSVTASYDKSGGTDYLSTTFTATGCDVTVAHTGIECSTVVGVGSGHQWTVTVGDQDSARSTATMAYGVPTITNLKIDSNSGLDGDTLTMATAGSTVVTILGTNFGPAADGLNNVVSAEYVTTLTGLTSTLGQSTYNLDSSACDVKSQTRMECTTVTGVGSSFKWDVTVGGQQTTTSSNGVDAGLVTTYAAPTVTSAASDNTLSTAGGSGTVFTVTGTNFGPGDDDDNEATVTYQNTGLSNLAGTEFTAGSCDVTSDTTIECEMAAGVGHDFTVTVKVGDQTGSGATTLSYAAPVISSLSPTTGLATTGSETVTLTGTYFGPDVDSNSVTASYDKSGGTDYLSTTFTATGCDVTVAHTGIECSTVVGVGSGHQWTVTVGDQDSARSTATMAYGVPTITNLKIDSNSGLDGDTLTMATAGSTVVTILGTNFGPAADGLNNVVSAEYVTTLTGLTSTLGQSTYNLDSSACDVKSQTRMECTTVTGVGSSFKWDVTVGGQQTTTSSNGVDAGLVTTYAAPTVTSAASDNTLSTAGGSGTVFTVTGTNFGPGDDDDNEATVTYQNTGLSNLAGTEFTAGSCDVTSDTTIECEMAAGVGHDFTVTVKVGDQTGSGATTLSYAAPVISSLSPTTGLATTGSETVTLTGTYFGPDVDSNSVTASYDKSGGTDYLSTTFTATGCDVTVAHTGIECSTVVGVGSGHQWTVTVGDQDSARSTATMAYGVPTITNLKIDSNSGLDGDTLTMATAGSTVVTILGTNFGPAADGLNNVVSAEYVTTQTGLTSTLGQSTYNLDSSACDVKSQTRMECTTIAGVGSSFKWDVTVGGQQTTTSSNGVDAGLVTTYAAPNLVSIALGGLTTLPTSGGATVTITGTSFGPVSDDNTVAASCSSSSNTNLAAGPLSATSCSVTTADTEVQCSSPIGVGAGHGWSITIGDQTDTDASITTSFTRPAITNLKIDPDSGLDGDTLTMATAGSTVVTILGTNFGPQDANNAVSAEYVTTLTGLTSTLGQSTYSLDSSACTVASHTRMDCTTIAGVGSSFKWDVTVGGQQTTTSSNGVDAGLVTTYAAPTVTSAASDNTLSTAGGSGTVFTVTGTNFGPGDDDDNEATVTYQNTGLSNLAGTEFTAGSCDVTSDTTIECEMAAGVGHDFTVTVKVGDQTGSGATTLSYAAPVISSLSPTTGLATTGSETVTLTGTYFGPDVDSNSVTASYDKSGGTDYLSTTFTATGCDVTVAHTGIECSTVVGVGSGHQWTVTVGDQDSARSTATMAYGVPTITNLKIDSNSGLDGDTLTMATAGSTVVTILGTNFGPAADGLNNVVSAEYVTTLTGLTSTLGQSTYNLDSSACDVKSQTRMECTTVTGVGSSFKWDVTVGGQQTTTSSNGVDAGLVTTYAAPTVTSAASDNTLSTAGGSGTVFTVTGTNFGPGDDDDNEATVTYQNTGLSNLAGTEFTAGSCDVTSDTTIECEMAAGVGHDFTVTVKVGDQTGSGATTLSYAAPVISSLSPTTGLATTGSETVTLTGTYFGPDVDSNSVTASYDKSGGTDYLSTTFTATGCDVTVAHTGIECSTVVGAGSGHQWTVTVGDQDSARSTATMAYGGPTITNLKIDSNSGLDGDTLTMATAGSTVVTILGTNFGPAADGLNNVVSAEYVTTLTGLTSTLGQSTYNLDSSACDVKSQTRIECTTIAGVGSSFKWDVTVGGQQTTTSSNGVDAGLVTTYASPSLSSLSLSTLDSTAEESIVLTGSNFGPAVSGNDNIVAYCENAALSSLARGPLYAGSCSVTTAQTAITCTAPKGVGYNQAWSVTVGDQTHSSTVQTSYTVPTVSDIKYEGVLASDDLTIPTDASASITIQGTQFGPAVANNDVDVYQKLVDSSGLSGIATQTRLLSNCDVSGDAGNRIVCDALHSVGSDVTFKVEVGQQSSAFSTETIDYNVPTITNLKIDPDSGLDGDTLTMATAGSTVVTILGTNFGPQDANNAVSAEYVTTLTGLTSTLGQSTYSLDSSACTVASHTRMDCTTIAGVGSSFKWDVTVGGQQTTTSSNGVDAGLVTTYAAPTVTSAASDNTLSTAGGSGTVFTVTGTNFGPGDDDDNEATVTYQNTGLSNLAGTEFTAGSCDVTSDTTIECEMAAGVGHDFTVTVKVGDQTGSGATTLSYAAPVISSLSPTTGLATTGSETVTLTGTYFGPDVDSNSVTASYDKSGGTDYLSTTFTATGCDVTVAHTGIECSTVVGVGSGHQWTVTVGDQDSARSTATMAYGVPTITNLKIDSNSGLDGDTLTMATAGSTVVTILGTNFGPAADGLNNVVSAEYVTTQTGLTSTLGQSTYSLDSSACDVKSQTRMECTTIAGVGSSFKWDVTVGGQQTTTSSNGVDAGLVTTYAAPNLVSIALGGLTTLPTSGGATVTITGTSFGPVSDDNTVAASCSSSSNTNLAAGPLSATSCSVTTADTEVQCSSPIGVGAGHGWSITIGDQTDTDASITTSFTRPAITNLKIDPDSGLDGDTLTMATAGSTVVTILGTNFGPQDANNAVSAEYVTTLTGLTSTLGQSTYSLDSSACTVASHTRMDCTTIAGVGSSFKWDVTVGGQQTTTSSNGVDAGLVTTYAAPTVTSAASDNTLSTAGGSGTVFTVTGTNFGPGDDDDNEATVTYQNTGLSNLAGTEFTAGSCDVTSDTTIECEMAAGVGHDFTVTVKVGDQTGSGATTLSYAAPVISSLSPTTGLATTGSETVTLTGTYFGPDVDSNSVTASYDKSGGTDYLSTTFTATGCDVTVAHTGIECSTVVGVGSGHQWTVTVGDQDSARSTATMAYGVPTITNLKIDSNSGLDGDTLTMATAGSTVVTILGTNFGPAADGLNNVVSAEYVTTLTGLTSTLGQSTYNLDSSACDVKSQTRMECTTVTGVGSSFKWDVTVGGQQTTTSSNGVDAGLVTTYAAPTVTSAASDNTLSTAGGSGTVFTVTGTNFGPGDDDDNEATVTYQNTGLSNLAGTEFTAGSCDVTSDTTIECEMAAGVGHDFTVTVKVGDQTGSGATTLSYAAPVISSLSPTTGLATTGSETVTLTGTYFGPDVDSNSVTASYDKSGGTDYLSTTFTATGCDVTVAHTGIECSTVVGVGSGHQWTVTVGDQDSARSTATMAYGVPTITNLKIDSNSGLDGDTLTMATAGSTVVTILGTNFGPAADGLNNVVSAEYVTTQTGLTSTLGQSTYSLDSSACDVKAQTRMECTTIAGVGSSFKWDVTVGGQQTTTSSNGVDAGLVTTYAAPNLVSIALGGLTTLPTSGGATVTITGTSFGPVSDDNTVAASCSSSSNTNLAAGPLSATSCSVTTADTEVQCSSPIGVGAGHGWSITIGDQTDTDASITTSFTRPAITNLKIDPDSGLDGDTLTMATAGSTVVTILGTNFGPQDANNAVSAEYVTTLTGLTSTLGQSTYSLDSSACTVASHTRMDCTTIAGVGSSFKWDVTVGGQQTTTSSNGVDAGLVTTYAAPTVTSAASDNTLSTAGGSGTVFTVTGTNFGPGDDDDNEATVTYQNTGLSNLAGTEFTAGSCDVTSDTTIECEMAAGVGHDFTVTVKVGDQTGSGATTLSYAAPVISSLSPTTGLATTGSETVTLTGTYFGPDVDSNSVTASYDKSGGTDYLSTTFTATGCDVTVAHTGIECSTVVGVGSGHQWTVTVGDQDSARSTATMAYGVPTITNLKIDSNSGLDGDTLTMATAGSTVVTILGTNFGPAADGLNNVVSAEYVTTQTGLTSTLGQSTYSLDSSACDVKAQTRMECTTIAGVGSSFKWDVTVGGQQTTTSSNGVDAGLVTTYAAPNLVSIALGGLTTLPTSGGATVTITGTSFGPVSDDNTVAASCSSSSNTNLAAGPLSATSCSVTTADTEVQCSSPIGVGAGHGWSITIGDQTDTDASITTSFTRPAITNLKIDPDSGLDGDTLTMATAGSTVVTILGTNFGPQDANNAVSAEYVTTLTGLTSTLGQSTYSLDSSACTVASHTRMDCTTIAGVGSSFKWDVTVGGQQTTTSSNGVDAGLVTTYASPVVSTVTSTVDTSSFSVSGGETFTINGQNFGPGDDDDNEATVTYQNSAISDSTLGASLFAAANCDVTSQTSVECDTIAGVGHAFEVRLSIGDQSAALTDAMSYAAPSVTDVEVDGGGTTLDTTLEEWVTLTGSNFGPIDSDNSVTAEYTNSALSSYGTKAADLTASSCSVISTSPAKIRCQAAQGVGSAHVWTVRVGGQDSAVDTSVTTSYAVPTISNLKEGSSDASNGDAITFGTSGGTEITILGTQFGPSGHTVTVVLWDGVANDFDNDDATTNSLQHEQFSSTCTISSATKLLCPAPEGIGTNHFYKVTVGGQDSSTTTGNLKSSYIGPAITEVKDVWETTAASDTLNTYSTAGGEFVTLIGTNFGPNLDNYNQNLVYGGHITVTYGKTVGDGSTLAGATFTGTSCTIVTTHTKVRCTTAVGVGTDHSWTIEIGEQASSASTGQTGYYPPIISDITEDTVTVGSTVTLNGRYFGPVSPYQGRTNLVSASYHNVDATGQAGEEYDAQNCAIASVSGATGTITCDIVQGVGEDHAWTVTVGGQQSAASDDTTSYAGPTISSITPTTFPTGEGQQSQSPGQISATSRRPMLYLLSIGEPARKISVPATPQMSTMRQTAQLQSLEPRWSATP